MAGGGGGERAGGESAVARVSCGLEGARFLTSVANPTAAPPLTLLAQETITHFNYK